ncbi:MAG: hypothetical protein QM831_14140 [Kofleriaceae bacterium]
MRRGLVPIEIAVIVIASIVSASDPPLLGAIPVMVPLLVAASMLRWYVGRSFGEVVRGPISYVAIGAGVGLVALFAAILIGAPIAEVMSGRSVTWSEYPIVRGNWNAFLAFAVVVVAIAMATELVLRGWVLERALELGASKGMAVFIAAVAEAMLLDGPLEARLGAFVVGMGLGGMYMGSQRNLAVTTAARVTFGLGALLLEVVQWVH